ncbi:MAG TPA: thrombospondin type 3 repeat-containing protein [bacterium]|nr:thrombospondin type 3 repeat-containing protein [bacterium]
MKISQLLAAIFAAAALFACAQASAFPPIGPIGTIGSGTINIPECLISGGDCDGDGVVNENDNCVSVRNGDCDADESYCDVDGDGEVTPFELDAGEQAPAKSGSHGIACSDVDGSGVMDYLEIDSDGDGMFDKDDNCPLRPNISQKDYDGDGVGDACDNCMHVYNPDQIDSNMDKIGDECSASPDDDGATPDPGESDEPEGEEGDDEDTNEAAPYNGNCSLATGASSNPGSGAAMVLWLTSLVALAIRRRIG